jgi:hypothetical protein
MPEIPTNEPSTIIAGDTIRWLKTLTDYPASQGWLMAYTLINAAGKITINGTASGDSHLIEASATTSAAWAAGDYDYRAQASKAGDVFTVGQGRITIQPSFAANTLDNRSQARKALEAVQAYLSNSNNIAAAEYEIQGRKLKRFTLPELWAHRDRLRVEVSKEEQAGRIASGLPDNSRVYVRFGR